MSKRNQLRGYIASNFTPDDIRRIGASVNMRYIKSENTLKGSSIEFNLNTFRATSFRWWSMLEVVQDKLVRNTYNYSSYTARHQQKVSYLLRALRIEPEYSISDVLDSTGHIHMNQYAGKLRNNIIQNMTKIYTPRTWKKTKEILKTNNRKMYEEIKIVNEIFDTEQELFGKRFFTNKSYFYETRKLKAMQNTPLKVAIYGK